MRQIVVMVTTSYPRFPGDGVGSFMEPIAKGLAARGHEIHVVAPWHPAITRPSVDEGVIFHFFRYAPVASLNVFGYAEGLHADTALRPAAWMAAPFALTAGWIKGRPSARFAARLVFEHAGWVTAPSDDLCQRAQRIGADPTRLETLPYGVDAARFGPAAGVREATRAELGVGDEFLIVTAGGPLREKGVE
jgi:glycosyltransferase involved in cell wall biosynthesis